MGRPSALDRGAGAGQCRRAQDAGVMSAPKIPDGPAGQRLRDKFEAYNLDPDNPENWVLLFSAMVQPGKAGRPTKWTSEELDRLNATYHRVQRKHPDKSEANICHIIANSGEFPRVKWNTLQRRLHDFRNPERNPRTQAPY